jgi:hypothetical protein
MTTDNDEENVLQVVRTAKGNHARGHLNQREIDVIKQEVMPDMSILLVWVLLHPIVTKLMKSTRH